MAQKQAYRIADAHTHIFPEKIAQKAADSIADFYVMKAGDYGTADVLLKTGKACGISYFLVCSVATAPKQVATINQFIADSCNSHPEFLGLGTLHPAMTQQQMIEEAQNIKSLGLKGIKLHPDIQDFCIDDPKMIPIYKVCADELDLKILFHCGDSRYERSSPRQMANVLDSVPGLSATAAHFGGYTQWEEAFAVLKDYPQLYFDTCSSLALITQEQALQMIEGYGPERLMFGSDYPLWTIASELERFFALPLSENDRKQILFGTFSQLYGVNPD